ncbi:hypothetical protein OG978_01045 [Streptomyces sp. NBC_01591]|uniref:hypothetical protein n=1 Tax=Streptomyces sp. NBC_01591 TaxID=2975888 RepID=UPI002DD82E62|nr:hypothetical protein [Streptomyces sp. NBC_01591]WSD66151.1 hypothetical protein OG978_01045 [Streptomyces sp. NBC_01591]
MASPPSLNWGNAGPGARLARASVAAERGILHPAPADAGEIVARIARARRRALRPSEEYRTPTSEE